MSTKSFVQKVANITGTGKKLFRDSIMDAGFVGHFDFNSDYCRNGLAAGAAANVGQAFKNLADGGVYAVVASAYASGFGSKGLIAQAGSGALTLPDAFKLPTNETHFAFCVWAGYNTAFGALPAAQTISIGGYSYQTGAFNQYALSMSTAAGGGALSNLRGYADGTNVDFGAGPMASIIDGNLHQLIIEFEVINAGAQRRLTGYFDGLQVAQITSAFDGALNDPSSQPSLGPRLGQLGGFMVNGFKGYYGRCWLKRFSLDPDAVPVATIAAKEWAKYGAAPRFA